MGSPQDYSRIIRSPSFTFLVGPRHTKLTIQSGLAQHVSRPMHNLMNGHTRESKHRIAVLEDEDVETFVAFCEYAYTGDYTVPSRHKAKETDSGAETLISDSVSSAIPQSASPEISQEIDETAADLNTNADEGGTLDREKMEEHGQKRGNEDALDYPQVAAEEESGEWIPWSEYAKQTKHTTKKKEADMSKAGAEDQHVAHLTPPTTPPLGRTNDSSETSTIDAREARHDLKESAATDTPVGHSTATASTSTPADKSEEEKGEGSADEQSQTPRTVIDMSFAKQNDRAPCESGLSLWDEFLALKYTDGPSQNNQTGPLSSSDTTDSIPYLTFHAKVYVFATRYLIPALAQLCLQKLHRDLLLLPLSDVELTDSSLEPHNIPGGLAARNAQMVLNLLHYVYAQTTRLEPISPTSATQLRDNELRRLVAHYAACKVRELAHCSSAGDSVRATPSMRPVDARAKTGGDFVSITLKELLESTRELGSDLIYRMM
ncbi:hypothetical protein N7474_003835 [Penicillium riverlandense]|uniref:uncharacterized protein n=1 Tax=Penicillium riverlandense TaxID=1903569 RepID=UPI002547617B|nr:uncharacterized protein N7474_003835 [Penicillium riverlandense]KAJ5818244.1 hypothetical protein N7474_003835 [Penicillium riverlandense]